VASRRDAIALTPDEVSEYLATQKTVVLCSVGPDGLPDPVGMWYLVEPDGSLLMTTYGRSQKVQNVRREPRVAALVEDGEAYGELRGVQLTGPVEIDDDDERVLDVMVRVAGKYSGAPDSPEVRDALRAQAAKRVLLRLVPEKVVSWDHRKL
jgi:PPOX class probable F420-dependent enzyme